jgi:hypothetical protein
MATNLRDEEIKPSGSTGERLVARLPERIQRQPVSRILAGLLAILALIALLIALLSSLGSDEQETAAAASDPAPTVAASAIAAPPLEAAAVDTDVAPAPGMDPDLAPPDGPAPDSPPFGVDALAMRGELRTHGVDLSDDKLYILVDTANKYIAEGDMDLDAWDPRIMADVKTLWPDLAKAQVIDVTRCTAEYIERVLARNAGLPHPPDEDDHNHTVEGRGPQARVVGN